MVLYRSNQQPISMSAYPQEPAIFKDRDFCLIVLHVNVLLKEGFYCAVRLPLVFLSHIINSKVIERERMRERPLPIFSASFMIDCVRLLRLSLFVSVFQGAENCFIGAQLAFCA